MEDIFSSVESFQQALKAEVASRFGRDFEDAFDEERYLALGALISAHAGINWKETKNKSAETIIRSCTIFQWNF